MKRITAILLCLALSLAGLPPVMAAASCVHVWSAWLFDGEGTRTHTKTCTRCEQTETANCAYTDTIVAPACTTGGYTKHVCADCGDTYTDTSVPMLGHLITVTDSKAATCTEDGWEELTCSRCDSVAKRPLAAAHTFGATVVAPTCTDDGYTLHACMFCGITERDTPVPKTGHSFGGVVSGEDGTHTRTCAVCNEPKTEDCVYEDTVTAPTCTQAGYTTRHCVPCGYETQTAPVEAPGHSWNTGTVTKLPTCGAPGEKMFDCTVCDAQKTDGIPATEQHDAVTDTAVLPTCTGTGLTEGSHCSACGKVLAAQQSVAALGHTWDEGAVSKGATCGEDGTRLHTCAVCTTQKTEPIPATGAHTVVTQAAVTPTCTEKGSTAGSSCRVCGSVLVEARTISELGHNFTTIVDDPAATCTGDGTRKSTCSVCHETVTEIIKAHGHKNDETPAIPATCTEGGMTRRVECGICGFVSFTAEPVEALGHQYEISDQKEATCTEGGYVVRTCTRAGCGDEQREETAALGHDLETETTEPTCVANGSTMHKCTRCEFYYLDPLVPALGHKYVDRIFETTCSEGGYTQRLCTVCGDEVRQNEEDPLPHTFESVVTPPTCTTNGNTTKTCSVCGEVLLDDVVSATGHLLQTLASNGDGTHTGTCKTCEEIVTQDCAFGAYDCLTGAVCGGCGAATGEIRSAHNYRRGDWNAAAGCYAYGCTRCVSREYGHLIGDADSDGKIDAADARMALRIAVGLENRSAVELEAADVDRDGVVTAQDARFLLRYAVGLETKKLSVLIVREDGSF